MKSPFKDLMSFSEATKRWGLHESTLRKAITYGKFAEDVDVKNFGKQWVITRQAMEREYGEEGLLASLKKSPE